MRIPRIVDKIAAINSSVTRSPIPNAREHVSRRSTNNIPLFNDRPPKKSSCHTVRAILARVVRLENRFVDTLDWTTIHEERQTGALAEAATTAAAPAIVPREYYTTPFPDPAASSLPTPFPTYTPHPPRMYSVSFPRRSLLAIHEHPTGTL